MRYAVVVDDRGRVVTIGEDQSVHSTSPDLVSTALVAIGLTPVDTGYGDGLAAQARAIAKAIGGRVARITLATYDPNIRY